MRLPSYFADKFCSYIISRLKANKPILLVKIFGAYRICLRNTKTNSSLKLDCIVIENLFAKRDYLESFKLLVFDLKGSKRNRRASIDVDMCCTSLSETEVVGLDDNFIKFIIQNPLFLDPCSHHLFTDSLREDTEFLSSVYVMDYSLLVGVSAELFSDKPVENSDQINGSNHFAKYRVVYVGLVDYVRTFTWDKKFEMLVKRATSNLSFPNHLSHRCGESGQPRKHLRSGLSSDKACESKSSNQSRTLDCTEPTIISPVEYRDRFLRQMADYFPMAPGYCTMKPLTVAGSIRDKIISDHDCFLFDCDGVLWIGVHAIDGARDTIYYLNSIGKKIFFVTNNSSKSRASYVAKIRQLLDFQASLDQIVSTSWLVTEYLKSICFKSGLIYLVGSEGIADELRQANFNFIGVGPDPYPTSSPFTIELDPSVKCVIAGFDAHISYPKIAKAASYIRRGNCHFIVTNEDALLPSDDKNIAIPGTGSIVSTIKVASGVTPVVLGKPHDLAWTLLEKIHDLDNTRSIMIGDRLETDIAFGRNCRLSTMAVFTGSTSATEIEDISKTLAGSSSNLIPHYVAESVAALMDSKPPNNLTI